MLSIGPLLPLLAYSMAQPHQASRPHIMFVLVDDYGQYNAGYRGDTNSKTPGIDALSRDGLVLERFYVHKWCAPTRSALMTGRNPIHTGLDPLNWTSTIFKVGGDSAVHKDYTFLPRLLGTAGYASHMLGKVSVLMPGEGECASHPSFLCLLHIYPSLFEVAPGLLSSRIHASRSRVQ
jgi:arylsulfatase A-like enzyme